MTEHNLLRFERLADWIDGRLSEDEAGTVAARVASDARAQRDVAWLGAFAAAQRAVVLVEPPRVLRVALRRQFAERGSTGLLQRLRAMLIFDSFTQPALAGVRSAGTAPRQLIYQSEAAEIAVNLHLRPRDQRIAITGQIFPLGAVSPDGLAVQLVGERAADVAITDEMGEFSFGAVAPGWYTLTLMIGDADVTISPFEVRGEPLQNV